MCRAVVLAVGEDPDDGGDENEKGDLDLCDDGLSICLNPVNTEI